MNPQMIRNLFQSISITHVSGIDARISLSLRLPSPKYLFETRPADIPLRSRNLLDLLLILQKILDSLDKSLFSQQDCGQLLGAFKKIPNLAKVGPL